MNRTARLAARRAVRWVRAPWRDRVFVATVVAAAAVPAFLVAAAGIWSGAAADEAVRRAVAGASPVENGLDVTHEVRFEERGVDRLDAAVRDAAAGVGRLEPARTTTYTLPGLVVVSPPARQVGPAARLLGDDDALDRLPVVDELAGARTADGAAGVWVSTWFLERHDLALGDVVGVQVGPVDRASPVDLVADDPGVFRIVGTYEPLWSEDPDVDVPPGWGDLPPEVMPRYASAFQGPSAALIVTDRTALADSGLVGVVRWTADLDRLPESVGEAEALRNQLREVERALVEPGELADAATAIAAAPGRTPSLTTEYPATFGATSAAVDRLAAPLGSARGIGVALGLLAMVPVGVLFVERRRSEFRLLAAEGERWWTIGARAAGQLLAPVGLGAIAGVVVAVLGLRLLGRSDGIDVGEVPAGTVVGVTGVATALLATVAGARGAALLRTERRFSSVVLARWALIALVGAAGFTWYQVGRTTTVDPAAVDAAIVLLPLLAMAAASLLAVGLLGALLGRTVALGSRWPVSLRLVVRRLATGSSGLRLVATAVGLGVGLAVFAVALIGTFDRVVTTKLASELGGASTAVLLDELPEGALPPGSTVVRVSDTALTPGRVTARVIAIDPDTWAEAVTWRDEFGPSANGLAEQLGVRSSGALAAIAVDDQPSPSTGAFGFGQTFPYEVVDRVAAFPGAGARATTILVSRPALDELGAVEAGFESAEAARAAGVLVASDRFRRVIISSDDLGALTAALDDAGVRFRDVDSVADRRDDAEIVATRSAFGYVAVLGAAAAVSALVGLGLSLSARRRSRALAHVMLASMGLSRGRRALVTALEVVVILVVAVAAAFTVVPVVVRRVATRFDPDPDVPPPVEVTIEWGPLLALAGVSVLVVGLVVAVGEALADRRPVSEVLGDAA